MTNSTKIILAITAILVSITGYLYFTNLDRIFPKTTPDQLNPRTNQEEGISWDECINTPDSQIQNSYPGKCITPDGQTATQPISSEDQLESINKIPLNIEDENQIPNNDIQ